MPHSKLLTKLGFALGMAFTSCCFTALAMMWQGVGAWALPALALSALAAAGIMSAVGELAARFPSAIGIRTYVKAAFGEHGALLATSAYLMLVLMVAALESCLVIHVGQAIMPQLDGVWLVAALFGATFGMNLLGYEFSARSQLLMVGLLFGAMLALAWAGLSTGDLASLAFQFAERPSAGAAAQAVVVGVFLFAGIEWVTVLQVRNPQEARVIHRVMFLAVGMLTLVFGAYLLGLLAQGARPGLHGASAPQLVLARAAFGRAGDALVAAVVLLAVVTTFNAGLVGAARIVYALARENYLPRWCAYSAPASGNPVAATALITAAGLACSLLANAYSLVGELTALCAALSALVYALFLAAAARLRRLQGGRALHYRSPLPDWALWGAAAGMALLALGSLLQGLTKPLVIAPIFVVLALAAIVARRCRAQGAGVLASTK